MLAMSVGTPRRASGIDAAICCSAGSHSARAMSVFTRPGAIALTRTPGASSAASVCVRWISGGLRPVVDADGRLHREAHRPTRC